MIYWDCSKDMLCLVFISLLCPSLLGSLNCFVGFFWVCLQFLCLALCSFFTAVVPFGIFDALVFVVKLAICFLSQVQYIFIVQVGLIWLLQPWAVFYVFSKYASKKFAYCLNVLQCCILYWKCIAIVYLTNHVSRMSVWGGFGHGNDRLAVGWWCWDHFGK